MTSTKKNLKTGIVVLVLLFPVFFVSLFYLRGRRDLGFDQKKNTFEQISDKGDTLFNAVRNLTFLNFEGQNDTLKLESKVYIIGFNLRQSKEYNNQFRRIVEAYAAYDEVSIIVFDSSGSFIENNSYTAVCCLTSHQDWKSEFKLPSYYSSIEVAHSFVLLGLKGYVKGVYDGEKKRSIDDLLLETKVLLKKYIDEAG